MKQERFVALHSCEWDSLQTWLNALDKQGRRLLQQDQALDFPASYRRVCHHLALARDRGYSHEVTERLQRLVQQGHQVLYQPPAPRWHRVLAFLVAGFPRLVRAQWRCMLAASCCHIARSMALSLSGLFRVRVAISPFVLQLTVAIGMSVM